jgi:hypothetical protein
MTDDRGIRCDRCATVTPHLRFVTLYAVAHGTLAAEGTLLCPHCRGVQSVQSAFTTATHSLMTGKPAWPAAREAARFDLAGGELDAPQNAFVLRHLAAAFEARGNPEDALTALRGSLAFEANAGAEDDVARLRAAGATGKPQPPEPRDIAGTVRVGALGFAATVSFTTFGLSVADGVATLRQRPRIIAQAAFTPAPPTPSPPPAATSPPPASPPDRAAAAARSFAGAALTGRRGGEIRTRAAAAVVAAQDASAGAAPPYSGYLYDLPRDRAFAASWHRALNAVPQTARAHNAWLANLETTAAPNVSLDVPGAGRYVIAWGCNPRRCRDGVVLMAYNQATRAVCAAAFYGGGWHAFGSAAVDDRAVLLVALARQQLYPDRSFPLAHDDAAGAQRFVEAIPD